MICLLGCMYSEWSPWTDCSKTCNNGHRDRQRKRNIGNGNSPCDLPLFETQDCNSEICLGKVFYYLLNVCISLTLF